MIRRINNENGDYDDFSVIINNLIGGWVMGDNNHY